MCVFVKKPLKDEKKKFEFDLLGDAEMKNLKKTKKYLKSDIDNYNINSCILYLKKIIFPRSLLRLVFAMPERFF